MNKNDRPRSIFVIRHGERLDDLFKQDTVTWKVHCNIADGIYTQRDQRMPLTLAPFEGRPLKDFADDPPLSSLGKKMAQHVGDLLANLGFSPNSIYSSPSLRCIQTAEFMSERFGANRPKIRVEIGLYGTSFSHITEPKDWLSIEELCQAGYHVDSDYVPLMSKSKLWTTRYDPAAYKERVSYIFDKIAEVGSQHCNSNILIVGHASTPDLAADHFTSALNEQNVPKSFAQLGAGIPYCGNLLLQHLEEKSTYSAMFDAALIEIGSFSNKVKRS